MKEIVAVVTADLHDVFGGWIVTVYEDDVAVEVDYYRDKDDAEEYAKAVNTK